MTRQVDRHRGIQCGRGDENADSHLSDAQHAAVFPSAEPRQFPQAPYRGGGTEVSCSGGPGGHTGEKYPHRAEPAAGCPYHEEVLMHEETSCGGHSERFCPRIITII